MCYELLPRKKVLTDEIEQRKEHLYISRWFNVWITEVRSALMASRRKHPGGEAQTPSRVRGRLAG
jgi:hypothetical protein